MTGLSASGGGTAVGCGMGVVRKSSGKKLGSTTANNRQSPLISIVESRDRRASPEAVSHSDLVGLVPNRETSFESVNKFYPSSFVDIQSTKTPLPRRKFSDGRQKFVT